MTARRSPEGLLQPGWREATHRINGLDLHVVEAGEAGRPLLVLLHGFPARTDRSLAGMEELSRCTERS